ncbi:MAG: 4-oxalocrotonate tautomerase [Alphaproteobacteria bacterium]|nr:MAG: 4-oxalocrotonate tautomerase [Alphaproteobacteria bacterium]
MAIVRVIMLEGRSTEIKARVIKGITEVMNREVDPDPSHVRVVIEEVKPENYGVAGRYIGQPAD